MTTPAAEVSTSRSLGALYANALPATRTGALYNTFSYPTKISPESIAVFVAAHTDPGDTVLDVFSGSGTTGLATKLCDKPTPGMVEMAQRLGLAPNWGPRRAVLYDVSVLGTQIASVMCDPPEPQRFATAAAELVNRAELSHGWLFAAGTPAGETGTIRHTIWADVLVCPRCQAETTYWHAAVRYEPLRLESQFKCPACRKTVAVDECERPVELVRDPLLGRIVERKRRVPVVVYGKSKKGNWRRDARAEDEELAERAASTKIPSVAPVAEIAWGDLYRAGYHRGITHLNQFYTPRNFLAIAVLWELIDQFDEDLRDALRLLVLSFNASHSTLMTRVVVKKNQKDMILTGAQTGVLYISGLPVEKNVFQGVRRKTGTFVEAFKAVEGSRSTVDVRNASSTRLDLPDGSVKYVFTDPPFGDYIPYAEINEINEAWLGSRTNRADEIVISPTAGRSVSDYGKLMQSVFKEVSRVLHDDGLATVVFHSAKADVWSALTDAYACAGLGVKMTSVLDKTQASFKQVVSDITVKGDPLILLGKERRSGIDRSSTPVHEVIDAVLSDSRRSADPQERTKERLFSRFITRCLTQGIPISVGASEFYALAGVGRVQ